MFQEIERKFLVNGDFKNEAVESTDIRQGYLCGGSGVTVRVRVRGEKGFLTIKGRRQASGISRFEWEKEITKEEAIVLLGLAEGGCVEKTRYLVPNTDGLHTWEVDVFHGENEGLIVAEIELNDENDTFDKPDWLGKEVSDDPRYFNSHLLKYPYKTWK
jgi:CYTH domain-containing protein